MKPICFIPARGGSKGIPRKNIIELKRLLSLRERIVKQRAGYKASSKELSEILSKSENKLLIKTQKNIINSLTKEINTLEKEIETLRRRLRSSEASDILKNIKTVKGINVLSSQVDVTGPDDLRQMADVLRAKIHSGIVVLGSRSNGRAFILAAITHDLSNKFDANSIIKELAPIIGGKGGGKKDLAQAGGNNPSGLKDAIEKSYKIIEIMLT